MRSSWSRRRFLGAAVGATTAMALPAPTTNAQGIGKKSVAAIMTVYRRNSHADVIVGKVLEGWRQDGGPGPALEIASMYVDQFPRGDLARTMAAKYNVPLCDTIEEAITLGGDHVAVDGVLSIGEHGDYPWNEKGQHLYPRRRFFEEITDCFQRRQRVVPVFNDKHLGPVWSDAKWMYERAQQMEIPLMAGSSLPVSFRRPDVAIEMDSDVQACLGVGYSGLDVYGFHTLEFLQCFLERRKGAETGVQWVQCLPGEELDRLLRQGTIRQDLLDAALKVAPTRESAPLAKAPRDRFAIFLIQFRDGLLAPVLMLGGYARGISAAVKVAGKIEPVATLAEERPEPRYPHFAYLLKAVEKMIHIKRPTYPVERTLLTSGALDRLLTSRVQKGRRIDTPELAIAYQPVDYPHAPHVELTAQL